MKQQEHLKNVPEYIIPQTLRTMAGMGGRGKRNPNKRKQQQHHPASSEAQKKFNKRKADPLDLGIKRKK